MSIVRFGETLARLLKSSERHCLEWRSPLIIQLREYSAGFEEFVKDNKQLYSALIELPDQLEYEWDRVGETALDRYNDLRHYLRSRGVKHLPQVRPQNYSRSIFHVCWGLIAASLAEFFLDAIQLIWVAGGLTVTLWMFELLKKTPRGAKVFKFVFGKITHKHESYSTNSATWYATAALIMTLLFDPVYTTLGVLCLGIGDPVAGIFGRRYGKTKLRAEKSLEGSLAFTLSAGATCLLDLQLLHSDEMSIWEAVTIAFVAGLGGAIAELFSGARVDDNFSTPLCAATAAWLAHLIIM